MPPTAHTLLRLFRIQLYRVEDILLQRLRHSAVHPVLQLTTDSRQVFQILRARPALLDVIQQLLFFLVRNAFVHISTAQLVVFLLLLAVQTPHRAVHLALHDIFTQVASCARQPLLYHCLVHLQDVGNGLVVQSVQVAQQHQCALLTNQPL